MADSVTCYRCGQKLLWVTAVLDPEGPRHHRDCPPAAPPTAEERLERAEATIAELREAARALLADLENNNSDAFIWCEAPSGDSEYVCARPATQAFLYANLCDEHAAEHRAEHPKLELVSLEKSYAPALRRLRALVEVKP